MPPALLAGLKAEDLADLNAYLRTLKPLPNRVPEKNPLRTML